MIALRIEDLKLCTAQLFTRDTFDGWLLREASVVTFNAFAIDGHIRQGYYTEEELESNRMEELSAWRVIRPICFSLIKGKRLPGSFQITLQLPPREVETFLSDAQLSLDSEQVAGLYLNFRYEEQVLRCVTATSLKTFSMDRRIDREWDDYVRRYLKKLGLACSEE